jgi:hypothetical protein
VDAFARSVESPRQIVDEGIERRLACASPQNLKRNGIGLKDTFRRKQHPTALRLAVREPHAARQPRLGTRRYREIVCQMVPCRSLPLYALLPQLTIALTSVVSALSRAINLPVELA